MSEPKQPRGIRCPKCGCCDLRTQTTIRMPGGRVRRYKVCRHCGRRVMTIEQTSEGVKGKPPTGPH